MRIRSALVLFLLITLLAPASDAIQRCRRAMALEKQGKLKEARDLYHKSTEEFRTASDQHNLAKALSGAGYVSDPLGDYAQAIEDAGEAIKLRRALHERATVGTDLKHAWLAYQYQGNYAEALQHY